VSKVKQFSFFPRHVKKPVDVKLFKRFVEMLIKHKFTLNIPGAIHTYMEPRWTI
jgi:hypothetical protein